MHRDLKPSNILLGSDGETLFWDHDVAQAPGDGLTRLSPSFSAFLNDLELRDDVTG